MIIKPTGMEQEGTHRGEGRARFIGNTQLRLRRADPVTDKHDRTRPINIEFIQKWGNLIRLLLCRTSWCRD